MGITKLIFQLKRDWSEPRELPFSDKEIRFEQFCSFRPGANADDLSMRTENFDLPAEILEFWSHSNGAILFGERNYGQWGLEILAIERILPATAEYRSERPKDFKEGDVVVGKFIGDSELLVIRTDKQCEDYGAVTVVDPIDRRSDWFVVAKNFTTFLAEFARSEGEKYWQINPA